MAHINIRAHGATCQVSAVGTNQTFKLGPVKAGDRIQHAAIRRMTPSDAATDSTWQLALTTAGVLGSTADTEGTVGSIADLGTVAATILADDVLELRYVQGATDGATAPKARVLVAVAKNQGSL